MVHHDEGRARHRAGAAATDIRPPWREYQLLLIVRRVERGENKDPGGGRPRGRHEVIQPLGGAEQMAAARIYCSRGLLRNSPPSSFVPSFAMRPRNLRDCSSSIPGLCGDARSTRRTSHRHWRTWATKCTTTSCATKS
jgi:hypothetical protein